MTRYASGEPEYLKYIGFVTGHAHEIIKLDEGREIGKLLTV
jgi:hypothetical protein